MRPTGSPTNGPTRRWRSSTPSSACFATTSGFPATAGRWRLPAPTARLAQIADAALQAVGLYEQRVHVLSEMDKNISCTIEKARRELGYRPTVGLEEGMRRSIAWCLEQGIDL